MPVPWPVNETHQAEWAAGYQAGLSGEPCEMPTDGEGWALYPSPSPQFAAWSRGHARGAVLRTTSEARARWRSR